ncbi:MAG: hypothetical protein H8D78_21880 [Chloroflexi bacterium]|nr:hypothetical protein [Chloroflexota bacterium]
MKHSDIFYWSDAFLDPDVEKTQVPVRYDPFDAGAAYAFVKGRWVRCISEHYARFAGRSEREMMLATAELRKRNQRHTRQFAITARRLADFLASLDAEEALLEQRLRDSEAQDVLAIIEGDRAYGQSDDLSVTKLLLDEGGSDMGEPEYQPEENVPSDDDILVIYGGY